MLTEPSISLFSLLFLMPSLPKYTLSSYTFDFFEQSFVNSLYHSPDSTRLIFLIIGKSTLKNNDRFASEYLEEARFVWLKVRVLVFERNEGENK